MTHQAQEYIHMKERKRLIYSARDLAIIAMLLGVMIGLGIGFVMAEVV